MLMIEDSPKHTAATRLFHATLALSIITQLMTSLGMRYPRNGHPGNVLFTLHQYGGFVALALSLVFWLTIFTRRRGTSLAALIPWFSTAGRKAVWDDTITHLNAMMRLELPPHNDHAAMPSAIHGLGLLLMTALAVTGTYGFVMGLYGLGHASYVRPFMELHGLMGNIAWFYLIGHASLGLLHHLARQTSLSVMWSIRG